MVPSEWRVRSHAVVTSDKLNVMLKIVSYATKNVLQSFTSVLNKLKYVF